jgi:hypothetical protein
MLKQRSTVSVVSREDDLFVSRRAQQYFGEADDLSYDAGSESDSDIESESESDNDSVFAGDDTNEDDGVMLTSLDGVEYIAAADLMVEQVAAVDLMAEQVTAADLMVEQGPAADQIVEQVTAADLNPAGHKRRTHQRTQSNASFDDFTAALCAKPKTENTEPASPPQTPRRRYSAWL